MKKLLIILSLLISGITSAQQNISNISTIPTVVTDAFVKKFPMAADVIWNNNTTKTTAGVALYKVAFNVGMTERKNEAWITEDGKVVGHKKEIKPGTLPEIISKAVSEKFPGFTIKHAERTENNGVVTYNLNITDLNNTRDIIIDSEGNIHATIPLIDSKTAK